eukprot:4677493-Amphidinium_carterae.1
MASESFRRTSPLDAPCRLEAPLEEARAFHRRVHSQEDHHYPSFANSAFRERCMLPLASPRLPEVADYGQFLRFAAARRLYWLGKFNEQHIAPEEEEEQLAVIPH